ncbi:hypothetical protein COT65_01510 [Candidatus Shapirobacteria bacterium CG09_land_8_20_14_0_10_47_13]|uniref:UDP-N-acetylmuramoyl-tripeptide--D-alanyl-D-alanine ligase n=1 Tax=Candidatus Shapirobacteria bacterium CG09_land_8_20_14_0_10_47_13 TaxID=1974481 RepID=A0A2H0WMU1_9BACT|nr:MAG: hypothetical protein COT65_01510 [Candidatus Shapirobacteria bacterium CG09_land_8_20_14_0_10_47_13]
MSLKSDLYLLQLEEYDLERFNQWKRKYPGKEVLEIKGRLNWTPKARLMFVLAKIFNSIPLAVKILSPLDYCLKLLYVSLAKVKFLFIHRGLMTIGITGSWGKTTTRDKLAAILASKYKVYKTVGNNNTLMGVAKNILLMPMGTEIFICEMGAYRPGEIKSICGLVHPQVGIITAIGPMHLERFGSLENIKKAKQELWDSLPSSGLRLGPKDEYLFKAAQYFDIGKDSATVILASIPTPPHRLEIKETNGLTIIDDAYNSNPEGFSLALGKLAKLSGHPKILVTPGMVELGKVQFSENQEAAQKAAKICDAIIVVGETNKDALLSGLKGLKDFKQKYWAKSLSEAQDIISKFTKPGAIILFENDLPDQYF